jgi:hypothetical protein
MLVRMELLRRMQLGRFVATWLRLFFRADSGWELARRYIPVVIATMIGVFVNKPVSYRVELWTGWSHSDTYGVGWVLFGVVLVAYVFASGGVAFVRSRGPHLWVADKLQQSGSAYHVRVENRGQGIMTPEAWLNRIEDGTGTTHDVSRTELRWSGWDRERRVCSRTSALTEK